MVKIVKTDVPRKPKLASVVGKTDYKFLVMLVPEKPSKRYYRDVTEEFEAYFERKFTQDL